MTVNMGNIKYPDHIEQMLDVIVALRRNAWGLVLLDVEKKIGTAALQRIISQAFDIENASVLGKGGDELRTARPSGDQLPV